MYSALLRSTKLFVAMAFSGYFVNGGFANVRPDLPLQAFRPLSPGMLR